MKRLYFYLLCCVGFILLCCSVCPVLAQAPTRAKIVFTDTSDGNAEIYVMNTDGSERVRLTDHPGDDFDPTWSPNGEHIAFVSERDHAGLYDIYLMDPNGQNIRPAFDELDYRTAPAWVSRWEKNRLPYILVYTGLGSILQYNRWKERQSVFPQQAYTPAASQDWVPRWSRDRLHWRHSDKMAHLD